MKSFYETVAEIEDTILTCEQYIADAESDVAKGGPLAWVFTKESVDFAHAQIKFEKNRLGELNEEN